MKKYFFSWLDLIDWFKIVPRDYDQLVIFHVACAQISSDYNADKDMQILYQVVVEEKNFKYSNNDHHNAASLLLDRLNQWQRLGHIEFTEDGKSFVIGGVQ